MQAKWSVASLGPAEQNLLWDEWLSETCQKSYEIKMEVDIENEFLSKHYIRVS